jgi:hypothetical protein
VYFERRRRRSVFIGSSPSPNTNPISVAIHLILSIKVSNTTAKRHRNKRDDCNLSPSISVDIHLVQYTETSDTTVRRDREDHFLYVLKPTENYASAPTRRGHRWTRRDPCTKSMSKFENKTRDVLSKFESENATDCFS